jgi:ABC-type lipoprotein release transport system permease subunit
MRWIFLAMGWRNMFYHRQKSILALSSVAACFFSLNFFQGYIAGSHVIFNDSYEKRSMLGDLVLTKNPKGLAAEETVEKILSKNEQEKLEEILREFQEVDHWMKFLFVTGTINQGVSHALFTGWGIEVEAGDKMRGADWRWNTMAGKPLSSDQANEVIVGERLALLMGCSRGSRDSFIMGLGGYSPVDRPFSCRDQQWQFSAVTLQGQSNAIRLGVSGIMDGMFRELDLRFLYMPLSAAQRLLDTDSVSFFSLKAKEGASVPALTRTLNERFRERGLGLTALSWKDHSFGDFYRKTMDFLRTFQVFMIVVILAVALLSIFNTFLRNVQERSLEFGVLRTLGFQRNHVRWIFLWEAVFVSLLGIAMGGAFALISKLVVNEIGILYRAGLFTQPVPFLIVFTPGMFFLSALLVLLVALMAASIPLWRNERKSITSCLGS